MLIAENMRFFKSSADCLRKLPVKVCHLLTCVSFLFFVFLVTAFTDLSIRAFPVIHNGIFTYGSIGSLFYCSGIKFAVLHLLIINSGRKWLQKIQPKKYLDTKQRLAHPYGSNFHFYLSRPIVIASLPLILNCQDIANLVHFQQYPGQLELNESGIAHVRLFFDDV